MRAEAMHPNMVHAVYMDHVNRGSYYVGGFLGRGPMSLSDYCAELIDRWNFENDGDCPRDYCTDREAAMVWINNRIDSFNPSKAQ